MQILAAGPATPPSAATLPAPGGAAAAAAGVPIVHLRRPGWRQSPGDRWTRVPDLSAAAKLVAAPGNRVFLTIGRQGVGAFAQATDAWFLIRAIDPPAGPLPPDHEILLARGPFTAEDELRLLTDRRIDVLVTKDSGGDLTAAKLTAARARETPVVLIDRPPLPPGATTVETVAAARDWLRAQA
ncbi:precorrin-6A/cobalt-precorrin-6A reductase [Nocardia wallacei]|uniref:precorrin-6A/cobalt-precorrin-6A reductase n=1 Tax=Nocardia wallacei TaxID=480035 RepID=UPI00313C372B